MEQKKQFKIKAKDMQKKHNAFTLVELIIVITILSILAIIGFISFQGFIKDGRDADRVTTISNMKKGLELYSMKVGKYPSPEIRAGDSELLTGSINDKLLSYLGVIGDNVSNVIKINKTAKDPLTKTNYIYGTTSNFDYYQVATITEGDIAYNPIINTTYANSLKAKVDGNYKGFIMFSSGVNNEEKWIANIPSLIFNNTGSTNLLSSGTYFVVNNKGNLPYNASGNKDDSIRVIDGNEMVKEITKSETATLTGVNITNINKDNFDNYFSGTTLESFNINGSDPSNTGAILETLKLKVLGSNNYVSTSGGSTSGGQDATPIVHNTMNEANCELANWYWIADTTTGVGDGFCISPRVTGGANYISWMDIGTSWSWTRTNTGTKVGSADNLYGVTYDLGSYTCKTLGTANSAFETTDTLVGRMKWLNTNKTNQINPDWVNMGYSIPAGFSVPAIMLADCIDGKRDLADNSGKTFEGVTYSQFSSPTNDVTGRQNMNKYLLGWTKSPGSHLPSAYSDILSETGNNLEGNKGEYQLACERGKLTDANDDTDNKWIWLSSVGSTDGSYWGSYARIVGYYGCGDQNYYYAGNRNYNRSARFVVR